MTPETPDYEAPAILDLDDDSEFAVSPVQSIGSGMHYG